MSVQNQKNHHKVFTALATPFLEDGEIDWTSFEKLVATQVEGGINGLVLCGTTGEAPALKVPEKIALVKRARALVGSKLEIMAGTGSNNTEQSVELSKLCRDAGADSLLVVTPPYNKPSLSGLVKHFKAISQATQIPICLYHVPGRTAQRLSASQMKAICEVEHVNSIKEASADLALYSETVSACPNKSVWTGDDPTYLPSLSVGGLGVVSVVTNVFPKAFVAMTKAFVAGDVVKAQKIHLALFPFIQALFVETNPTPLKAALSILGLCQNTVRMPLDVVQAQTFELLKGLLSETQNKLAEVIL